MGASDSAPDRATTGTSGPPQQEAWGCAGLRKRHHLSLRLDPLLAWPCRYVRSQPEAVLSVYEAARGAGLRLPRHEMHGVIFAHIEMKEPIKAFKHLLDILDAGHAPVPPRHVTKRRARPTWATRAALQSRMNLPLPVGGWPPQG